MNIKKIILIIAVVLMGSCSEEFLEVEPQNKFFAENFYLSENQVFQGLIAAYNPLQWTFVDGFWTSSVMLGEIWSDNANAGGDNTNFDQPGWQDIDDLNASALINEANSFWKKYYYGIGRANLVINNVEIESPVVTQYQSEAKFLRAFYHFELVRTFGPIPITTTAEEAQDASQNRNTLTEVYTQITTDLLEAIPNLPESYSSAFAGRITKGAAQALLGKAYIYWADLLNDDTQLFAKAAEQLQAVIQSNQYGLVDDYNELFAFATSNTAESVFEIQYSSEVAADFSTPFDFINGNMIIQLCGIRGLCSDHPDYVEGWGFMLPTQNLYDAYLDDDDYRREAAIISESELNAQGCSVGSAVQNPQDFMGYWQQKYANFNSYSATNGGEINVLKDGNQPYIRYADVLLMCAEALVRGGGSESDAMTYIDMVRERAVGPGDNTGNFQTAANLMGTNGWSLLDVIWYERRAELAGEGDRWFDLVRSGRATAGLFSGDDLRSGNFDENDLYLPAPQSQVDISGGGLTIYPDASLFQ